MLCSAILCYIMLCYSILQYTIVRVLHWGWDSSFSGSWVVPACRQHHPGIHCHVFRWKVASFGRSSHSPARFVLAKWSLTVRCGYCRANRAPHQCGSRFGCRISTRFGGRVVGVWSLEPHAASHRLLANNIHWHSLAFGAPSWEFCLFWAVAKRRRLLGWRFVHSAIVSRLDVRLAEIAAQNWRWVMYLGALIVRTRFFGGSLVYC